MWEIIRTYIRLEEMFNLFPRMSTPQEEIRWADDVSDEIIERNFIYSSSYRLLITSIRRFFQSGTMKRRLAKKLIIRLGDNSLRDEVDEEDDYQEELDELNERFGRYEVDFLHGRYHKTDPPGTKKLEYQVFKHEVKSYFEEKFSQFRISIKPKAERLNLIATFPSEDCIDLRTKEESRLLKQLVRFFAEFTANFFLLESNENFAEAAFDRYFMVVLNHFLKSKDNDRTDCINLMVLISMTRSAMSLSVNTDEVRSKLEILSKERTFSPAGRSMLKDLLRVMRLQVMIGNEAERTGRWQLRAFAKLISDLIEKEDILEHHNVLQQRLNELELMDSETLTTKLKDVDKNNADDDQFTEMYRRFGRPLGSYSDISDSE